MGIKWGYSVKITKLHYFTPKRVILVKNFITRGSIWVYLGGGYFSDISPNLLRITISVLVKN